MKKYLLLIEDEKLWENFKSIIKKDINSEIIDLIRAKAMKDKNKGNGTVKKEKRKKEKNNN